MSAQGTPRTPLEPATKSNKLRYIAIAFAVVLSLAVGFQFVDEEIASRVYDPVRASIGQLSSISVSSGAETILGQFKNFTGGLIDKPAQEGDDNGDYSEAIEKLHAQDILDHQEMDAQGKQANETTADILEKILRGDVAGQESPTLEGSPSGIEGPSPPEIIEDESRSALKGPLLDELPSIFNMLQGDEEGSSTGPTLFAMSMSDLGHGASAEPPVESIVVESTEEKLEQQPAVGRRRRRLLKQPGRKHLDDL